MATLDEIGTALQNAHAAGDANAARQLAQAYTTMKMQGGQAAAPNAAVDVARSIPGGLAKGASAIAGMPGDVVSFMKTGDYQSSTPFLHRIAQATNPANVLPTSQTIAETMAKPFGGFYKPQTVPGQYAETISSFAPAALSPGSAMQRMARVAAPSVASETAGQMTKGTPFEPYARAGGALLGGGVQGFGEGMAAERAQTAATPTTAQVRASGHGQYQSFAAQPVTLTPEAMTALGDRYGVTAMRTAMADAELNHEHDIVNELHGLLNANATARPAQLRTDTADKIRQAFDTLADNAPRPNTARGWEGRSDAMETSVQQTPGINDARNTWAQFRKSQTIDRAMQRATDAAGTPAGFGDPAQAMRREFLRITRSREFNRFTPDEQAAITSVANGNVTSNTLQQLGKFSPVRGHITRWLELGGAMSGHAPEALGAAAVGEIARQGSNFATARGARLASELVRSGGTTTPQLAAPTVQQLIQSGVLAQRVPFGLPAYARRQETQ